MQSFCALCNRCFLSCCPERICLGDCFNTKIYNFLCKHLLVLLLVSTFTGSHWILFSLHWDVNTWKNSPFSDRTCRCHPLWSCFPLYCYVLLISVISIACIQLNSVPVACSVFSVWHQNIGVSSCPVFTSVLTTDMLC